MTEVLSDAFNVKGRTEQELKIQPNQMGTRREGQKETFSYRLGTLGPGVLRNDSLPHPP